MKQVFGKDEQLLKRLFNKDEDAFIMIRDKYAPGLYSTVYAKLDRGNKNVAEDIVQNTFLTLWEEIHKNSTINNLGSFLYRIANNQLINYNRAKANKTTEYNDTLNQDEFLSGNENIEVHLHQKEILRLINDYTLTLPPVLRSVGIHYINGVTSGEIAELLDMDRATVDVYVSRFREKLLIFLNKASSRKELLVILPDIDKSPTQVKYSFTDRLKSFIFGKR